MKSSSPAKQTSAKAVTTNVSSASPAAGENQPVEIIPGRLYWISDKTPPKSR